MIDWSGPVPEIMYKAVLQLLPSESWGQSLWNGILGAFVGGGSAALIALFVLHKTTAEQKRLAAEQLEAQKSDAQAMLTQQKRLAKKALTKQAKQSEDALELQREIANDAVIAAEGRAQKALDHQAERMDTQLKAQRRGAALEREKAARAQLVAQLIGFLNFRKSESDDGKGLVGQLAASCALWRMESGNSSLRKDLDQWPQHIYRIGWLHRSTKELDLLGTKETNRAVVVRQVNNLIHTTIRWTSLSEDGRTKTMQKVNDDVKALKVGYQKVSQSQRIGTK